jgi:hypothetical protein
MSLKEDGNWTVDHPMNILFNELAVKSHLKKIIAVEREKRESYLEDYEMIKSSIDHLNGLLQAVNIHDSPVIFVYHMLTLLNQMEKMNYDILEKYSLKCSIFILEDLKLSHQRKKLRFNQMFKLENKSYERLIYLQQLLSFYHETHQVTSQFLLFFMPTKIGQILELESEKKGENKRTKKGKKNLVQRIFITDMTKDKQAWDKFLSKTCKEKISFAYYKFRMFLTRKLRTPLMIKINPLLVVLLKLALVTLFCIDFVS